jgi:hypothetical protein
MPDVGYACEPSVGSFTRAPDGARADDQQSGLHNLAFAALPVGLAEIFLQDLARGVAW